MSNLIDNIKNIFEFVVKNEQTIDSFAKFLQQFGYVDATTEQSIEDLIGVIREIQVSAGLVPTGTINAETLGLISRPRCALKDKIIMQSTGLAKWGNNHLTYLLNSYPSKTVTQDDWIATYDKSFKNISAVCGLTFERVTDANNATLIVDAVSIDGPSQILGETELPNSSNFNGQLTEHIDRDEKWLALGKNGQGIYLLNVITHESCHYLGLGHCMTNPNMLMAPYYTPGVSTPQSWDINQLQMRYGPPVNQPNVPSNPQIPVSPTDELTIKLKGNFTLEIPGYNLSKK